MKRALTLLLAVFISSSHADTAYLQRFMNYSQWSQNLPSKDNPAFIQFIQENTPLANKLREKWLYQLAQSKDWSTYTQYYQPSNDLSLQCYALLAKYQQHQEKEILTPALTLWLTGDSRPPACDALFTLLLSNHSLDETALKQRVGLALEKRNVSLANHLLKQFNHPRTQEARLLATIEQNPLRITTLPPSDLQPHLYLYGLKRLVSRNMTKAIQLWQKMQHNPYFGLSHQQAFLAHVALYKAMRDEPDAPEWFALIKPAYYNPILIDWQLRYAIHHHQWARLERLIPFSTEKDKPCWQYWLARAAAGQGHKEQAKTLFTQLAQDRNYYGFLASIQLHRPFNFSNEPVVTDLSLLRDYQPITEQIKSLYLSKQSPQASRQVDDFALELPKNEKSAFIYWIDHELKWYGKSVHLSNADDLSNQLTLRFPLAYQQTVTTLSKSYHVPAALVYAMIRQESSFRNDVVSPVGAQGLMQLMPSTAKKLARKTHIRLSDKQPFFFPPLNIQLGTAYLQELAKYYNNRFLLVIAAYNAGPQQVNYWLKHHDPQEVDIWIETLPWPETRNYLKNVIAYYIVYQYRMHEKPDLTLFYQ